MNNSEKDISREILSEITIFNKYARYLPEKNRRESWDEIVTRNMEMHLEKFPYLKKDIEEAYQFVYEKKVLPSMRSLQFAGKAAKINPARFLNWANDIGINALLWVKNEFENATYPPNAYRKLNAVLSASKIYGKVELDLALEYALANGVRATASVKSILDKKLYLQKASNNGLITKDLFNNHEYIRGNIYQ